MSEQDKPRVSVVVPVLNEAGGIDNFHQNLVAQLEKLNGSYEIIYCDDGSTDASYRHLKKIAADRKVRLISLSRNFGKEIAITAGIHEASGKAIITIDGDGQHPVELIAEFIKSWEAGAKVVVGLRTRNQNEGFVKSLGSKLFYGFFSRMIGLRLVPGATDFRLIDRSIQQEFSKMTERNRITRGLIDWLGYKPDYIEFRANPRASGSAGYSFKKLFKLAIDSAISLSISPLYLSAYVGAVVLPVSALVGLVMIINAAVGDPLNWHATGSAYVIVLLTFLVGILLVSQGIIGLYLSHIHTETQNRPLYIIDKDKSINVG